LILPRIFAKEGNAQNLEVSFRRSPEKPRAFEADVQIGASFKLFVSRRGDGFSAQFTANNAREVELLMTRKADTTNGSFDGWQLFQAEAQYAESILRDALGDVDASIAAARRALEIKPDYAPAVLTMGSIEYQLGREAEGRRLFRSLLLLPDQCEDLWKVIDKAGSFLIQSKRYADAMELYDGAVARFPNRAVLYQGLGCCAGHEGLFGRAVAASQKALDLDPVSQDLANDLGWSLVEADRLEEAEEVLLRAAAMDPSDDLARENLRLCQAKLSVRKQVRREAIGLGGHNEVVTVQAADLVRPPGDGDAAPLR
jgi:tetratricopeptide (TPR) repeat protein